MHNTRPEIEQYIPDDLIHEEDSYPQRPHTSIRTYQNTQGEQVIERGSQRIIVHQAPPPKRRMHPVVLLGSGMVVAAVLFIAIYAVFNWWQLHQIDVAYGNPRTYQTDAIIYPGDSSAHPTHYIFLNLNGSVQIIEEPHGDASHAKIYIGPTLIEDNASLVPVTGEFKQINGKEEMIVHVGDQELIYLNNGQKFIPQQ